MVLEKSFHFSQWFSFFKQEKKSNFFSQRINILRNFYPPLKVQNLEAARQASSQEEYNPTSSSRQHTHKRAFIMLL